MPGTVRAAVIGSALLNAVADDLAATVGTLWRQRMNGTFEAIEGARLATDRHREGLIVLVAAYITLRHDVASPVARAGIPQLGSVSSGLPSDRTDAPLPPAPQPDGPSRTRLFPPNLYREG